MKKALVTGGAGFIGSHLIDKLVNDYRWSVIVLDNFSTGKMENIKHHLGNPYVEIVKGDLKDFETVYGVVRDIDVVFHFAANPEVRVSTIDPRLHFNENIVATFNLLEAMRKRNIRELVFASSSSVYGESEKIPVNENAPMKPVSVYGASKAACENLIHAYSYLYGIKAVVLRYANVVGPRLRHGVVYDFVRKLLENPNILEILGDGTQIRSYIYVDDAVEATLKAWKNSTKTFEVYNVASEDWISVNEVAETVIKALRLSGVKQVYKPVLHGVGWAGDVKQIALTIDKLKNIGWKPKMSSKQAVLETKTSISQELKNTHSKHSELSINNELSCYS